jgi:arylsulfatase A-like enzyme
MSEGRPWDEAPCAVPTEFQLDAYTGWKAAEWIRNYRGDKPFYYQVCFPGPHDPYDSPAEYRAKFKLQDMPLGITQPPTEPFSPLVALFRSGYQSRFNIDGWTDEQRRLMKLAYYAKVTLIDHYIGEIVKALKARGLLDNTWIIHTSDHGDFLGERCLIQKMMFFDEALNIPCIIRPPDGVKGWKSNALTDQLDIVTTLLDIAGAKPLSNSQGRSLLPIVKSGLTARDAHKGKEALFSEVLGFSTIRTERYKMSFNAATLEPADLYDMVNDPKELRNLANDPAMEKVRRELQEQLKSRLLSRRDEEKFKFYQSQPSRRLGRQTE